MPRTYTCTINKIDFSYRGCTRKEIEDIISKYANEVLMENELVKCCLISSTHRDWPNINWDNELAGIISQLALRIREVSGLSETSQISLMEEAQAWAKTPAGEAEIKMMIIFHKLISEIQNLEPIDWYKQSIAAEIAFAQLQGPPPSSPQNPNIPIARKPQRRERQKEVIEEDFSAYLDEQKQRLKDVF